MLCEPSGFKMSEKIAARNRYVPRIWTQAEFEAAVPERFKKTKVRRKSKERRSPAAEQTVSTPEASKRASSGKRSCLKKKPKSETKGHERMELKSIAPVLSNAVVVYKPDWETTVSFLNAALCCLLSNPVLNAILRRPQKGHLWPKGACVVDNVFRDGRCCFVNLPKDVLSSLFERTRNGQYDEILRECLNFLIEVETVSQTEKDCSKSSVRSLLQGEFCHTRSCLDCGTVLKEYEPFLFLNPTSAPKQRPYITVRCTMYENGAWRVRNVTLSAGKCVRDLKTGLTKHPSFPAFQDRFEVGLVHGGQVERMLEDTVELRSLTWSQASGLTALPVVTRRKMLGHRDDAMLIYHLYYNCGLCLNDGRDVGLYVHRTCGGMVCRDCWSEISNSYGGEGCPCPVCEKMVDELTPLEYGAGSGREQIGRDGITCVVMFRTGRTTLFGSPLLLVLPSTITGVHFYRSVAELLPSRLPTEHKTGFSLHRVCSDGLKCHRCPTTAHCTGCLLRLGDSITLGAMDAFVAEFDNLGRDFWPDFGHVTDTVATQDFFDGVLHSCAEASTRNRPACPKCFTAVNNAVTSISTFPNLLMVHLNTAYATEGLARGISLADVSKFVTAERDEFGREVPGHSMVYELSAVVMKENRTIVKKLDGASDHQGGSHNTVRDVAGTDKNGTNNGARDSIRNSTSNGGQNCTSEVYGGSTSVHKKSKTNVGGGRNCTNGDFMNFNAGDATKHYGDFSSVRNCNGVCSGDSVVSGNGTHQSYGTDSDSGRNSGHTKDSGYGSNGGVVTKDNIGGNVQGTCTIHNAGGFINGGRDGKDGTTKCGHGTQVMRSGEITNYDVVHIGSSKPARDLYGDFLHNGENSDDSDNGYNYGVDSNGHRYGADCDGQNHNIDSSGPYHDVDSNGRRYGVNCNGQNYNVDSNGPNHDVDSNDRNYGADSNGKTYDAGSNGISYGVGSIAHNYGVYDNGHSTGVDYDGQNYVDSNGPNHGDNKKYGAGSNGGEFIEKASFRLYTTNLATRLSQDGDLSGKLLTCDCVLLYQPVNQHGAEQTPCHSAERKAGVDSPSHGLEDDGVRRCSSRGLSTNDVTSVKQLSEVTLDTISPIPLEGDTRVARECKKLARAIKADDAYGVVRALKNGADPCVLVDDVTALHLAAGVKSTQRRSVLAYLLKHAGRVDVATSDGTTPLHVAAAWGHRDAVELLVRHGADATALADSEGNTALDIATGDCTTLLEELTSDSPTLEKIVRSNRTLPSYVSDDARQAGPWRRRLTSFRKRSSNLLRSLAGMRRLRRRSRIAVMATCPR